MTAPGVLETTASPPQLENPADSRRALAQEGIETEFYGQPPRMKGVLLLQVLLTYNGLKERT